MRNIKSLMVLLAIVTLMLPVLNAQTHDHDHDHKRCGADEYHEFLMQNPDYKRKFIKNQEYIKSKVNSRSIITCANGTYVIPIAVHFNGGVTNANMSCIADVVEDQINALNQDFGGYNADVANYCALANACPADFPPNVLAGDACIQFCLATQNHPAGYGLSNGDPAITFGQFTFDAGASDFSGYFNIFVSNIAPPGSPSGLLGLAPLGGAANPDGNGMYVVASSFGGDGFSCTSGVPLNNSSNYNLGRTGTHEAGHYFSLPHTFAQNDCNSSGDDIADTPPQSASNGGNIWATVDLSMCGAANNSAQNTCGTNDFWFNYMDYSDDLSLLMFTTIQATNMYATAELGVNHPTNGFKTNVINCPAPNYTPLFPTGCPAPSAPESAFINDYAGNPLCATSAEINFTDQSTDFPTSWAWTFSGAGVSPTSSTEQNPQITYSQTGTITATLTATNNAGSDPTPASQMISVTIEDPANCGDCGASFYDTGGASSNYVPNMSMTWTLCSDLPTNNVNVNFNSLNLHDGGFGGPTADLLFVKNGTTPPSGFGDADYVGYQATFFEESSPGSYSGVGLSLEGTGTCMSFFFSANSGTSAAGWDATVECIPIPTCTDGIQNQDETFVDCGGSTCPSCPSACGSTFYDAGGANNDYGLANQSWTICADSPTEVLVFDFSTIDMGAFNDAVLFCLNDDGDTAFDYYITASSVYVPTTSGVSQLGSTTFTSSSQCMTFNFNNFDNLSFPGWVASVSCCEQCPNAVDMPSSTTLTLDPSCSAQASDIAGLRQYEESDSRDCNAPFANSQTMLIQCDGSGGDLDLEISANPNGGDVDAFLYGPIGGTCPNYTNVTQVDCESGPGPLLMTRTTNPNEVYILEVRAQNAGDITVQASGAALPVEYKSFDAIVVNEHVSLSWTTLVEINNAGFHVEKSTNGRNFERIAFVESSLSNQYGGNYNYLDKDVIKGQGYYYRLVQTDWDGKTSNTEVEFVYIKGDAGYNIYPNPTSDVFNINLTSDNVNTAYALYDIYGKLVKTGKLKSGINTVQTFDMPAGIYLLQFETNGQLVTEQVVLNK